MVKIKQFEIIGKCLYWSEENTLIIGDLHLGYENCLNEMGIVFPKSQLNETIDGLKFVFEKLNRKTKRIILLGDVKHHFGGILYEESRDINKVLKFLKTKMIRGGEIIITKGNHDNILEPILRNHGGVGLVENAVIKNVLFLHGDSYSSKKSWDFLNSKNTKLVVVAHHHPAITLSEDSKKEKYKCFAYGKSEEYKKEMIYVPSFFSLVEGSDIFSELDLRLTKKKIYAVDSEGKVYDFSKLDN